MGAAGSEWVVDAVCSLLRQESPVGQVAWTDATIEDFLRLARTHGVTCLLDDRLARGDLAASWPEAIRHACHADAVACAMHELALQAELVRVFARLDAAGVRPLVLKGTALAYGIYPRPALRMRGDTDLLVPHEKADDTASALADLGYERGGLPHPEVVSSQATWSRTDALGATHHLDVHWRASNRQVLAREFSYEELAARACSVPGLGPHARMPSPVDALLYACAHRAGHVNTPYYSGDDTFVGGDRLIWLYDVHLLATRMTASEFAEFVGRADTKRLRAICLDALAGTMRCFATPIPATVLGALGAPGPQEPSARHLQGRRLNQMTGDFLALDNWPLRFRWFRELGFPPAEYMRQKYPDAKLRWLPALYLRRALGGLRKVLSRQDAGRSPP